MASLVEGMEGDAVTVATGETMQEDDVVDVDVGEADEDVDEEDEEDDPPSIGGRGS